MQSHVYTNMNVFQDTQTYKLPTSDITHPNLIQQTEKKY